MDKSTLLGENHYMIFLGFRNGELYQTEPMFTEEIFISPYILQQQMPYSQFRYAGFLLGIHYYLILDNSILDKLIHSVDKESILYKLMDDEEILKPFHISKGINHWQRQSLGV